MASAESVLHQEVRVLYGDHHGWLQGWLRRRLGSACDAADLAHDVFMRLLARRHPIEMNEPRAYLSAMARGLVIDHWRRREIEQAWLDTVALMPEATAPSPESRLLVLETLIEIDRMLDALKPAVRTAFLLAQFDGLSCREIGERLGVSLATAERYVAKALRACYAYRFDA
ncbi:sigma-70 family RNA polymerase sigma factor [Acidovorax cavernicola]|uniref:Sigma-70 family RNA polymerase sigma factor n=1 Tax=Acidovorax cavernicola TaxID=1675792 RepID=A0A9X8GXE8_9BURK|nr:sigma-70 family RNA polymerase sigma factor [Acidovorax cavernicola]RIX85048.1 sigma-70 family RNA polymerase sigma factor [Acidovorax cavernicola]